MSRTLTTPLEIAAAMFAGVLLLVVLTRAVRMLRGHASRARIVTVGLLIPAAMGLGLSASTSYRFAGGRLGITDLAERMTLCGTAEAAIIALTLHAWGARSKASAWLAYALVGVQAVPAFSVSGGTGGIVRIVLGPVLLALMLHKLLGLELKLSGEVSTGLLASAGRELRERVTARLGIGRRGADSAAIARSRAADRAVTLASRRRLGRLAAARLSRSIDTAQHGLDVVDAAAAEASIVARIVRRKSVAELHALDARHVWSTSTLSRVVSAPTAAPAGLVGPDTSAGSQASAEPVVWVRPRGLVSGRRSAQTASRTVRRARSARASKTPAQQAEPAPVAQQPETRPVPVQEPKKRLDTKLLVHALHTAYPSMTPDTIADKVGLHERTVRRHLNAPDVQLEHVNGTSV